MREQDRPWIAVTGATGLVGSALRVHLESKGTRVRSITRSPKAADDIHWSPSDGQLNAFELTGAKAVVHLAGETVAQRWTDKAKERILNSRTQGTNLISSALASLDTPPPTLISASAVGFYGARGEALLDERDDGGEGFLANVCALWEAATEPAKDKGIRVVHARLGLVLDDSGGMLTRMLPAFRVGLGGRLGQGNQFMSWVHSQDVAAAIEWLIEHESLSGPANLTAPNPVSNVEFTRALGQALRRPTLIPLPAAAAKLALGTGMAGELLLSGQRVIPGTLLNSGFDFRFPFLDTALQHLLNRR